MTKKEGKLIYDITSIPDGMSLDEMVFMWKEHDYILYNSNNGNAPIMIDFEDSKSVLIDVLNTEEETLKPKSPPLPKFRGKPKPK